MGIWRLALPGLLLLLAGCATPPAPSNRLATAEYRAENDPLQPLNRQFYRVNNVLDTHIAQPLARTYLTITTQWFRTHAGYFVHNLSAPLDTVYFMASGKPRDAGTMLMRFAVNSTVGLGGIFNPAASLGYPLVETDLGLVLAGYGVPAGPYLFIPLVGPLNVRDALCSIGGAVAGGFVSPFTFMPKGSAHVLLTYGTSVLGTANERSSLNGTIEAVKATALDPYAVFRSLYRQHRAAQLRWINAANQPSIPDWYAAHP